MNTGPFSQVFHCSANLVISAINRVSTLHLSQVVHVNVVQTQPRVTHKHSWPGQGSLYPGVTGWLAVTDWSASAVCTALTGGSGRPMPVFFLAETEDYSPKALVPSSVSLYTSPVDCRNELLSYFYRAKRCRTSFQEELPLLMRSGLWYNTGSQVIHLRRAKYCHSSITLWDMWGSISCWIRIIGVPNSL